MDTWGNQAFPVPGGFLQGNRFVLVNTCGNSTFFYEEEKHDNFLNLILHQFLYTYS